MTKLFVIAGLLLSLTSLADAQTSTSKIDQQYKSIALREWSGKRLWLHDASRKVCAGPGENCKVNFRGPFSVTDLVPGSDGFSYFELRADDGRNFYIAHAGSGGFAVDYDPVAKAKSDAKTAAACARNGPRIGMTMSDVQATCWGKPYGIRKLTTSAGTVEMHTYYVRSSNGMRKNLYFTNGTLTAIED